MPSVHLDQNNVKTLAALNGKRTDYADDDCPGLVLRVAPTGSRTFVVVYYFQRKKRRYRLGELRKLGLKDARARARKEVIGPVLQGRDPVAERKPRTATASAHELTVGALVGRFMKAAQVRPKTRSSWEYIVSAHVERTGFGERDAHALHRRDVKAWLAPIAERAPVSANRTFQLLRLVYNWALEQEIVEASPCTAMKKPAPQAERESDRVLTRDELRALLPALGALEDIHAAYVDATRLLMLTGVRESMAVEMSFPELALDQAEPVWVIPGGYWGRTKNQRAHVVPLVPQAVAVIERRLAITRKKGYLFPRTGDPRKPMTWSSTYVRALRYAHGVAWAVEHDERLPLTPDGDEDQEDALVRAILPRWTVHNLRHTIATRMREDLGVARDVVGLIIGHTPGGGAAATRIYDRSELLPARRAALVAWASWLDGIGAEDARAKVLPMRAR